MTEIKPQEYDLLNEIAHDSLVTQASLAQRLGIAVGSVNWYIKRLIKRGYVKVSHLDRTRLQYDLTPEGMSVFRERAVQYAKDSLKVYTGLRNQAITIVAEVKSRGISSVSLEGNDEIIDIMRLTCVEAGLEINPTPDGVVVGFIDQNYHVSYPEQENG